MERILAACGNDCSACPRYSAHPYEKSEEELHHTAELWLKIGYRDHVVSNEEITCNGCKPENWCRYRVVRCCEEKGIKACSFCPEYPCENIKECFDVTASFEPKCRQVCSDTEYTVMKKAFFDKELNLLTDQAITYINDLFRDNAGGHDIEHTLRVYRNAMLIAESEMNTETARELSIKRHAFLESFLKELDEETITGGLLLGYPDSGMPERKPLER